jgi:ABC-type transport system substrate-binding protein
MRTWPRWGLLLLVWDCLSGLLGRPLGLAEHLWEPEARFGGTYRRALANNPAMLDPAFVHDIDNRTVVTQIAQGLVHFDAHLNPIPAIAEFWEASRDGRIWTFSLRQGVQFHHGREVTTQDVVYAFTRLRSPQALGPATEFFRRIQGAEAFIQGTTRAVQGLRALDRDTLPIT